MIKLVELNYHCHTEYTTPEQVIAKHALSSGFIHFIKNKIDFLLVKHLNYEGEAVIENIRYGFFKSRNKFWYIPFKTNRFIKKEKPDIVLSQGLIFPLQVIALRFVLGPGVKIIVQHHGERPFTGVKKLFQKIADRYITAYFFTSNENAAEWIAKKIIHSKTKCYEVLEASTQFGKKDKLRSRAGIGLHGNFDFLWVGRLNILKDPLTVLKTFEKLITVKPAARLYMIYQTEELLLPIKQLLENNEALKGAVHLIGKLPHHQLETWYNAADFFISGSHKEGSGYALIEAMMCGCIPVLTAIPSFKKITGEGEYGILYEPGNVEDLYNKLIGTYSINKEAYSDLVYQYAKENLSHRAIADQIYQVCLSLVTK